MEKINWQGKDFVFINISPYFRVAMLPETAEKFDADNPSPLAKRMSRCTDEILVLPIEYPAKPIFTLFVFPNDNFTTYIGREFPEEGMCGIRVPISHFPLALAVDENWFMNPKEYPETISQHIGHIHELGHIVHGAFFTQLSVISEGFAEALPQYIMGLSDPEQVRRIIALPENEIATLKELQEKGMVPSDNPELDTRTNHCRTYMSAYLWMRGYLNQVEQKEGLGKFEALNFILHKFKEIDTADGDIDTKMDSIGALIGVSGKDIYQTKKLQLQTQSSIRNKNALQRLVMLNHSQDRG